MENSKLKYQATDLYNRALPILAAAQLLNEYAVLVDALLTDNAAKEAALATKAELKRE